MLYVRKIGNFPKGLTHDFGQKFQLSSLFVLLKIGPEMMFRDVLGRKEAFLDNKNMYFQDFRQKLELSSLFVFINKQAQK